MTAFKEEECIKAILNGSSHAFELLVDEYKQIVFTLAFRMLKNREEAEEIAQDVFLKVYKSLASFKRESKFSTWLYRITYNACLDKIRRTNREEQTLVLDDFNESRLTDLNKGLELLEQKDKERLIRACFLEMPHEESYLLTLYYFEEQSVDEIAKAMNWTKSNVKVRLYRSRKKMASLLQLKMEPEEIKEYG